MSPSFVSLLRYAVISSLLITHSLLENVKNLRFLGHSKEVNILVPAVSIKHLWNSAFEYGVVAESISWQSFYSVNVLKTLNAGLSLPILINGSLFSYLLKLSHNVDESFIG